MWGTSLSYSDYLQAKSFVGDVTSASREAGRQVSMEVSRQTREVIASNECLAREQIAVQEKSVQAMQDGFEMLSYGLSDISSGISELNATFHWGFSEMLATLGHMNDTLSELVKIAKTPVQTVAFNHFEIARDAFRQSLYKETLEELEKAISGDHTSPGYKLEWRFHHMRGVIRLGSAQGDFSLVDLAKAEESFLAAARYAKADYPQDAGRAFLSAGWACYCQGKMTEALDYTEQAMKVHPGLAEAFFQAAKVLMSQGETQKALPLLGKAIESDRFYAMKAAGDGDFKKNEGALRDFLEALRKEKYLQGFSKIEAAVEKTKFLSEHSPDEKDKQYLLSLKNFISQGSKWSLMDMLFVLQNLDAELAKIEDKAKGAFIILSTIVTEDYQEEVIIKPGGFFRKAVTEMQTKTRKVERRDSYRGNGALIAEGIVFVDGHGIIIDFKAGLQWYVGPDQDTDWDQANAWVKSLTVGGGGWRMPTIAELKSLYHKGMGDRNMPPEFKTTGWVVWSNEQQGSSAAWYFGFGNGYELYGERSFSNDGRAFAVRSR